MYLSKISIKNFRGIKELDVEFAPDLNIIIGENGSCKSALIDAIKVLYNLGREQKDIYVNSPDFYLGSSVIEFVYEFRGLSNEQKGALYECMVVAEKEDDDYAKITLNYKLEKDKANRTYYTGEIEGQRADINVFKLLQHYYLGALRDSSKDLLNTKVNILGGLIKRLIEKNSSEKEFEELITKTNKELLSKKEVTSARDNINKNLNEIFKKYPENQVGLSIEQSKVEYIVNLIKPFLPHDKVTLEGDGFSIWQNSLGLNNLIYIATILGDVSQRMQDDINAHFALLIEEPEAHLHPQLQLNLYNFLKETNQTKNSQLFITTHSPTLTSKVPLENLILLDKLSYRISNCFTNRDDEGIIENVKTNQKLVEQNFQIISKKLERYIDVTKSQLFFARGILIVEGISEELLISAFAEVIGYRLEDYRIELVNADGTSFSPFLFLFNSSEEKIRLPKKVTILTDDDRFTQSKKSEFSFDKLFANNYEKLNDLFSGIWGGKSSTRIDNLNSVKNSQFQIQIESAFKTFEFEIALWSTPDDRRNLLSSFFIRYLNEIVKDKINKIIEYTKTFQEDKMSEEERYKVALLLWKALPSKSEFAQDFSFYISQNMTTAIKEYRDRIPNYIIKGLKHLSE
ncbi:MAG: AAA family ATPase [Bacteroidetes bacterium]|nr:AAA family ATPase [Bacteroidota bacterium]